MMSCSKSNSNDDNADDNDDSKHGHYQYDNTAV